MTTYRADTVVACATAAGRGAIAIVRWSGRDALAIAARMFRPNTPGVLEPWRMRRGTVLAADGVTPVDDVLGVYFPAPKSFTGEDLFEIHAHGSPIVVEQILASAIAAGARAAEAGEFTRRAVLNGKLDLLQAEAVADLVNAKMAAGARAAWRQLQGALSDELGAVRETLMEVLADIEAQVDFTDDELPEANFVHRTDAMAAVTRRIESLLDGFSASRRQRDGLRVVFSGKPNAGKSSLVNRILGSGRMIVSEEPGTTRDVVEESVDLGGIAFVLADTAGIRDAVGAAETEAVARARATLVEADLRILVIDASMAVPQQNLDCWDDFRGEDTIVALNKSDLGSVIAPHWQARLSATCAAVLRTSATTGNGCDTLVETLGRIARERLEADPVGISRVRHRAALERALEPLRRAQRLAGAEDASELAAVELRTALAELAAISAPLDNEDVLDRIFSEFCIGK